jgi:plastocyanin
MANGTLFDPNAASDGSTIVNGVYTVSGTAAQVTADLDALVFHPTAHQVAPGNMVTTGFTIQIQDTARQTATDSTTSVIATAVAVPVIISGTQPSQAVNDNATIDPFAHVLIGDANFGQSETVTISLNGANGTLTDPNAASDHSVIGGGSYMVTGTAAQVSADLNALVFTPTAHQVAPGQTVTTSFTIHVQDTAGQTATDNNTSVIATAIAVPPTITGTVANQAVTDHAIIDPFAHVKITDLNFGQTDTVIVTPSQTANGTLFDPNAATDGSTITNGIYKVTGTAAQVTADLDALIFHPTPYQVAPGNTVTTGFTIAVTDSPAGLSATDTTTTVIAKAVAPNYALLQQDGTNFLLAQYAHNPNVAEATVNGQLTKLLTDLGDYVAHPMTSTNASVPNLLAQLVVPVSTILADVIGQSPNLVADNVTLVGVANTLGHGFQVV